MPQDLTVRRDDQNPPTWTPDKLVDSIKTLAADVEASVVGASDWYLSKRKAVSRGARWSRVLAIAFVTLGGLAPLIWATFDIKITKYPTVTGTGIGYLCLALAAAAVALDRYAGFSSSWMRRITTAQALKRLVVEFRVQWPPLLADVEAKKDITPADVKLLFERIAKLAGDAEDVIKEETRLWKVEFESAFAQLEKASQAKKAEGEDVKEPATAGKPKLLAPGEQAPAGKDLGMKVKAPDAAAPQAEKPAIPDPKAAPVEKPETPLK
ncbi:MAG TPA: SLATT domain-containing protein [Thermoanaerobaculia bacterium]|nr:SLATT domain-containing protein [Thermoanaerobaculia bacterium]